MILNSCLFIYPACIFFLIAITKNNIGMYMHMFSPSKNIRYISEFVQIIYNLIKV